MRRQEHHQTIIHALRVPGRDAHNWSKHCGKHAENHAAKGQERISFQNLANEILAWYYATCIYSDNILSYTVDTTPVRIWTTHYNST